MESPRTAVYVARVHLAIAALVVVAGLAGGIAMQLELWSPGGAWGADYYGRMLKLHSLLALAIAAPMLAGGFGYLAIAERVAARRTIAPAIAWSGLALWVIGLVATAIAVLPQHDSGWTFYTPYSLEAPRRPILPLVAALALAASGLVYAIHLGAILVANRRIGAARLAPVAVFVLAIAGACIGSIAAAVAPIVGLDAAFAGAPSEHVLDATAFAAVVLATVALARDVTRGPRDRLVAIAIGCAAVWAFTPLHVLALGVTGLWIALAVLGGFGRPVVAVVVLGAAPVLVLHAFSRVVLRSPDLHLHDTHFKIGELHAIAAVIAFAGLAAVTCWSASLLRRLPHPLMAWLGACTCSAGTLLHVYASLRLGASGMPRRYWDYDPGFTAGHRLAGVGAAVVVGGLALLVVAWVTGRAKPAA